MEVKEEVKRTKISSADENVPETPITKQISNEEPLISAEDAAAENSTSWSWGSLLKAGSDLVGKSTAMVVDATVFMKRDLSEFTEAMQKDTAIIMNDATQSLKEKISMEEASKAAGIVKSGISSFFGSINASLAMFDEQQEAESATQEMQTRSQARLSAIQRDPNTFQREPPGRPEDFEAWLIMFDINKMRSEMERLLDSVEIIQEFYNRFVPLVVTHNEFWQRYFYRLYQLEKDEKRIQSLMARSSDGTPEDLDWGDESEGAGSPSILLDPSEVCSVVSNESFQMVGHETVLEQDVGDTVLVDTDTNASSHSGDVSRGHKQESFSSLGEWDHGFEDPHEKPISRDDTPTPE